MSINHKLNQENTSMIFFYQIMKRRWCKFLYSCFCLGWTNLFCLTTPQVGLANSTKISSLYISHPTITPNWLFMGKSQECHL